MKIGLYFGSFNPIHIGHLIIANHIIQFSDLNEIWFVVSPHNPLKEKSTLLTDYHRLALVNEAIKDNDLFRASDIEFKMEQPSYTVKTLVALKEKFPYHDFSLIMGEDNVHTMDKWYNYEYILENYSIWVYPRAYDSLSQVKDVKTPKKVVNHPSIHWIKDAPTMNISSSHVRRLIREGKNVKYLLPNAVWKYIDEMGFYQ